MDKLKKCEMKMDELRKLNKGNPTHKKKNLWSYYSIEEFQQERNPEYGDIHEWPMCSILLFVNVLLFYLRKRGLRNYLS